MSKLARPDQLNLELLPEERLLLAIGKLDPSSSDRARAHELLRSINLSWDDTFALAAAHRVHPILAYNLERDPSLKSRVPGEFHRVLRGFRAVAVMRRELYSRTLAPIVEILAAQEIRLVLLKGAALIETVYPHGTRLLNDFDILIQRCNYERVTTAFVEAGFSKRFREGTTEVSELENYHQIGLTRRVGETMLSVDLHWLLYPTDRAFCQIDTPTLMSRSRRIRFGATSTFVLSAEDMFVHCASQLVNDELSVSYQRMGDIYAMAKSSLSWESTVEIASRAGAAGATHFALSVSSMLGANVPSWAFRELRRACVGCHLSSEYLVVPSLAFRSHAALGALPILNSLLYSRQRDRIRFLRLFISARWQSNRRHRGTLRSCLVVVRRIAQASRLSVKLLAAHLPWWDSAGRARRLEGQTAGNRL